MIQNIKRSLLKAAELVILTIRITKIVKDSGLNDNFLLKLIDMIETATEQLKSSLSRERASEYTGLIEDGDTIRDNAFMGFREHVSSKSKVRDTEVKKAAESILTIIKKFGWTLYALGYSEQSTKMDLLIDELSTSENKTLIKKINAEEWVQELTDTQKDFEDLYNQRLNEDTGKEILRLREAHAGVSQYITILIDCLNIAKDIYPEIYLKIEEPVNEAVTDIMSKARSRKTRNENQAEEN